MVKKNKNLSLGPLDIHAIKEKLCSSIIGRDIRYLHRIDSTNSYALEAALHGAEEGTIILADQQTGGRGRHQREWESPAYKGIYLSIILKPKAMKGEPTLISLLSAVVIAEALKEFTPLELDIKWPNDVLIKDKKIAGILIEINTQNNRIMHIVVGIGINVLQEEGDFSSNLSNQATSLLLESGLEIPREAIIIKILHNFEGWYKTFKEKGPQPVMYGWKQLSSYWRGKRVAISTIDRTFVGITQGINDDGSLMVKKENGLMERVVAGNIILLREDRKCS